MTSNFKNSIFVFTKLPLWESQNKATYFLKETTLWNRWRSNIGIPICILFLKSLKHFYTINNIWRWKTTSTRLLFLSLINFTSFDYCFFPNFLFSTFFTLIFLLCFILATFFSYKILSSSLSFFFFFTLACIISSYLSDVVKEGECSIDCFRFCLVVSFAGQTSTFAWREKQNFCDWFFATFYIGMHCASKFTLMRKQIYVELSNFREIRAIVLKLHPNILHPSGNFGTEFSHNRLKHSNFFRFWIFWEVFQNGLTQANFDYRAEILCVNALILSDVWYQIL